MNQILLTGEMISKKQVKFLCSLKHKKYRSIQQKFLVEGLRNCEEALNSDYVVETIYIDDTFGTKERESLLLKQAKAQGIDILAGSSRELGVISDTMTSQGIIALLHMRPGDLDLKKLSRYALVLAIDQINDPGNLGTIIRTASWFATDAILLSDNCVDIYNPKVVRASMGTLFHVPIYSRLNLINVLDALDRESVICATRPYSGMAPDKIPKDKPIILVLGSEAHGLGEDLINRSNLVLQIPRYGKAESLNVAVAAGILLAEIRKRIKTNQEVGIDLPGDMIGKI